MYRSQIWNIDRFFLFKKKTVDVWDGPDGEPIITHGQTLTGTLYVRDVLADAIKPYAFKSSPYPLILSIENHLSPEQQDVLAIRFKDILAGRFFTSVVLN
jgi:phosphatidylinositol phospholipase C, delta